MARPREYDRETLALSFEQYIDSTDIPIIAEWASMNHVSREALYEWDEFITLLKKCTQKKESALERQALAGDVNVTMAIFSLKQLGWSDKQETKLSGDLPFKLVLNGSDVNG